jgi:hypothetical protein
LRRAVIAEAKRMGVRVRATENDSTSDEMQVAGGIALDVGATTPTSPEESVGGTRGQSTSEADQGTQDQPSLGLQEGHPVPATFSQIRLMEKIARERGIEVPAEATKSEPMHHCPRAGAQIVRVRPVDTRCWTTGLSPGVREVEGPEASGPSFVR